MSKTLPCVLMRAGTSRGPFFLREWLPDDDETRDQVLIGAIGASDPLQLDGVGGGSTLNSKVAIVSRSTRPDCDLDYLFAQVGVGQRSVDTRPNCGNMLSGVLPFALEQGLIEAADGTTTARIFNVNTGSRIEVTVQTPGRRITYDGDARIDGVAGTAAPIHLNFLDAWGAVTGSVFPTGRRIDTIDGVEVTCIDAAMPLMIVRAGDLGLHGSESPAELDSNQGLLERLEALRRAAGDMMGLGDVSNSVVPKPVLVSAGDSAESITSRYFTPRRCHASHAVTGAIGVASAFALSGTVASRSESAAGVGKVSVLHPAGRIDIEVDVEGTGASAQVKRASLLRTARKILQGELHIPDYVLSKAVEAMSAQPAEEREHVANPSVAVSAVPLFPSRPVRIIVPTVAGGGNDTIARTIAQRLGELLGQPVIVDNRAGANGTIAAEYVAGSAPDGHTLMFGYIATHAMNPALQRLRYDPVADFEPISLVGYSPTLLVACPDLDISSVGGLVTRLRSEPGKYRYASAGIGTAPHFAGAMFALNAGTDMQHRPYDGAAHAVDATMAGQAHFMFPSLFTAARLIKNGKLRALAVAGPRRTPVLPEVPTLAETGVDGVDVTQWYALFAPAGTPSPVVDRLNELLRKVLADPVVIGRIEQDGAEVKTSTPAELRSLVQSELEKWRAVVRAAKNTRGLASGD
ncbi:4-oxalomesaconate tautomerase [Massilia sp. ZL223]|uniref:4-oxalomesaconate tautomerase n=1 Tax=Massilia sp. ZL223 TaxID=2824904 RepID=UPI001B817ECE|nr:4-oxalomesaconate tautomerase [Massilia sp. ZL223]MBQ5965148.1 4-oxalomesaconate tautomerase [Massilia sp. ZL223]